MSFALSLKTALRRDPVVTAVAPPAAVVGKHFIALDGLRGIAILMVVILHFSPLLSPNGWEGTIRTACYPGYLGVTLFFVLSGFLITRILIQTRSNRDYFVTFFLRRALRIFPLYYAYIAFMILLYYPYSHYRVGEAYELDAHWLWYVAYASNIRWDRFADGGMMQLWSLAIEEQFYMVWPIVVFLTPRRWLLTVCGLGIAASLACRVGMTMRGWSPALIYTWPTTRMDALLAGAVIGIIELNPDARERLVRALRPLTIACLATIAALWGRWGLRSDNVAVYTWGWSVLAAFFALVVFWAATAGGANRLLNIRWLRGLGKYSYGIYVLHMFPLMIIPRHFNTEDRSQRILSIAACVAATAVATAFSWHFIERPFLRRKQQLASSR